MLSKVICICLFASFAFAEKVRYDNFTLYEVHPENEEQFVFLKELYEKSKEYDFWRTPVRVGEAVSVVAPPELRPEFEHSLKKRSIFSNIVSENIQEAFDAQLYSRRKRDASREIYWSGYQTLDDIYAWFELMAETYPDVVSVVTGGHTYEGRDIKGIKISRQSGKKAFIIEGGSVGADWLSPTVVTYIANQLIRGDEESIQNSRDYEWYIFPITNPDGFEYSQESVRLWYKNRSPTTGTNVGVDLTLNWNSQWGVNGGSWLPAESTYIGMGPFSERETMTFSAYIESIGSNLAGFLSFRAFGQKLLLPFAHTTSPLYNYEEMVTIGRRAMGSLAVRYNTIYTVGTSAEIHDGATGSMTDWVKHRFNPPVAATYLLRDTGTWGYILPVSQVQPTCEETYDSIQAIIREATYTNVL